MDLFWRARRRVAERLAIRTPQAVEEATFLAIGGIEQWVQIRGEHRDNPVMLMLHGGPGASYAIPYFTEILRPWERHFTLVQWDRRGVGKTYARNGKTGCGEMTFERMVRDGIELAEYLRARLGKQQIILLGHSAGSVVGLRMVKRRPDLFSAYVGADQIVDMERNEAASYQLLRRRLQATGDEKRLARLAKIAPPPFTDMRTWHLKQRLIMDSDGTTLRFSPRKAFTMPHHSLKDVYAMLRGYFFSARTLFKELMAAEATSLGLDFAVPMFFFQGDADIMTVTALTEEYCAAITAPRKELVILEGGPHLAMMTMPDVFLRELLARVPTGVTDSTTHHAAT